MRMKEFTEKLANEVEARLNGVQVTPTKNWKNNSVVLHGLNFCKVGENIAPIIYIDQFFTHFEKGELSVAEIVEQVVCDYEKLSIPEVPDLDSLLASPQFIDRIKLRLVNMEENRKMIEERNLLHYEVGNTGLVCLFYAKVFTEDNASGEMGLPEIYLERYLPNIDSAEMLYQVIIQKMNADEVYFEPMKKILTELLTKNNMDISILDEVEQREGFMYVLSDNEKIYGAYVILTEAARQKILNQFPNGKVTIFPSSVHELILIETRADENIENLQQMVREINHTELSKEEFLCDEVFHYDAFTGELTIAGKEVC